jgi:hypothetical protein
MALPTNLAWDIAKYQWATALNPVVQQPLLNSYVVKNQPLVVGATKFNHNLGRTPQGWIIIDTNGVADIYRDSVSAPFNALTLTLTSSAAVTVSVLVF